MAKLQRLVTLAVRGTLAPMAQPVRPSNSGRQTSVQWKDAELVLARPGPLEPELVSDGGGPPFPPAALLEPPRALDPNNPAEVALLEQIDRSRERASRGVWRRWRAREPPPPAATTDPDDARRLTGWRVLARTEEEILYGRGQPPQLVTVVVRLGSRGRWECVGVSSARPLRACRDGIRASSWRLDPERSPAPEDDELRILVTERSRSSGMRAHGRILPPELHADDRRLTLRLFIRPQEGFQNLVRGRETPVRVALPERVGERELADGALWDQASRL